MKKIFQNRLKVGQWSTSDEINWKGVAWQTVGGAALASTGAIAKVGKWLTKLF